jgi:hypothetical protein
MSEIVGRRTIISATRRRHRCRTLSVLIVPSFLIFAMRRAHGCPGCDHRIEMTSRLGRIFHHRAASVPAFAMVLAVGACALLVAGSGLAQENRPPADPPPAAQAPSPPPKQPSFIDSFGRWLEEGAAKFKTNMQSAQEKLDKLGHQAREATKDASGAVVGLPNTRIVIARELCATASNGAADCQTAATTLCRGKGFAAGKSLDTQSEQKCNSGRFLLEGRAPNSSECPTQTFVTRAMCQ